MYSKQYEETITESLGQHGELRTDPLGAKMNPSLRAQACLPSDQAKAVAAYGPETKTESAKKNLDCEYRGSCLNQCHSEY